LTLVSAATVAALAGAVWLLRWDGAWDTYRGPLFWPFLFGAGMMVVFSLSDDPDAARGSRALVVRVAAIGAVVMTLAALVIARNPIHGLHARDIVVLAALEAGLIVAAGTATELGERYRPGTWIRTGWCAATSMVVLAIIPRVLLLLH
jgi:hypothetical protein